MSNVPDDIMQKFLDLAIQLSPENLEMDGEASPAQVKERLRIIRFKWASLELRTKCKVTEDEVWAWERQRKSS